MPVSFGLHDCVTVVIKSAVASLVCNSFFFPLQKTEKTEFLSFFYKYCMHVLTAPLLANTAEDSDARGEERLCTSRSVLYITSGSDPSDSLLSCTTAITCNPPSPVTLMMAA